VSALYYSDVNDATYFPLGNKLYPAEGLGEIIALLEVGGNVLVGYREGWFYLQGTSPDSWTWKRLNVETGTINRHTLVNTPYSFAFFSRKGLYIIDLSVMSQQYGLVTSSGTVQNITENKIRFDIKEEDYEKCRLAWHENTLYLAYREVSDAENAEPDGFLDNWHASPDIDSPNKVLRYEWGTKAFSMITGWHVNQWIKDSQNLLFASRGYLVQTNSGGYDDWDCEAGAYKPVRMSVKTKEFPLGDLMKRKELHFLGFALEQPKGVDERDLAALIEVYDRPDMTLNGAPITPSLVWGRKWGKRWGFKRTIMLVWEVIYAGDTFTVSIDKEESGLDFTCVGLVLLYRAVEYNLPSFRPNLKDDVLLR
jgi:hypothetical protein